jgi:alkanesulfonate monooxygenase SsuD/methylene tetrahydromethanopterin reductase-like flavin-dependent oxidoreductase (luciferase family)/predicted kinase
VTASPDRGPRDGGPDVPDPALVVLVGPSGSGKSTWAAQHYRATEVVSSDALRAVVGSGPNDLSASADAFAVLETVVTARAGRGLTTVVDTLGLDPVRRRAWLALAGRCGLPAVTVLFQTPATVCRERNRARERPVPAAVLTAQLRSLRAVEDELAAEGWTLVLRADGEATSSDQASDHGADRASDQTTAAAAAAATQSATRSATESATRSATRPATKPGRGDPQSPDGRLGFVLQLSRFPWGKDPVTWLSSVARAAQAAGCEGIALMDHLIQIPQVGRDWEDIPEPFVALGLLAAAAPGLRLGTLVSPLSLRSPGLLAKAVATLDVLCGGLAFCGVGAGWWEREHAAYDVPFGSAGQRLDRLESGIETMRALWRPGTSPYTGERMSLPETTSYPRPVGPVPVIVGGRGPRLLGIAARLGDGVNLPSERAVLEPGVERVRTACAAAGRDPAEVAITVLDVPVLGRDRDHTAALVERLRGRTSAAAYARQHHAGTAADHIRRYRELVGLGVSTVFVALPDLAGPDDLERLAPVTAAFSEPS